MNQVTAKRKKLYRIKVGPDIYPCDKNGIVVLPESPKQTKISLSINSKTQKCGVCNDAEKVKVTNSVQNDNPNCDIQSLNYQDGQIQIDRDGSENSFNQSDQSNCNQSDKIHFNPNDCQFPELYDDQFPLDDLTWLYDDQFPLDDLTWPSLDDGIGLF